MPRPTDIVRGARRVRCSHGCEHAFVHRSSLSPRNREPRHPRWAAPSLRNSAGICSSLVRAIGLNLLLLVVAWIVVEFVLERPGLRQAFPTDDQREAMPLYLIARLLGYHSVAFLAACAGASVLAAASDARLTIPRPRTSLAVLPVSDGRPSSAAFVCVSHVPPCEAYPRAPPVQRTLVSSDVVGNAHWSL